MTTKWVKVVHAYECDICPLCEEPVCPNCKIHYCDCKCPGSMQDCEYEYKEVNDVLYARKLDDQ